MFTNRRLELFYYRYKDSVYYNLSIFLAVIMISLILFFRVVMPQVQNWFSINSEINTTKARIAIIRENIKNIKGLNEAELDSQLQISTAAMPFEKDYAGILNSIANSASATSVNLDDFTLSIGNLSGTGTPGSTPLPVQITLLVKGSAPMVKNFMKEIESRVPLAEVSRVEGATDGYTVNISFYYKPNVRLVHSDADDSKPILPLSAKNRAVLEKASNMYLKSSQSGG